VVVDLEVLILQDPLKVLLNPLIVVKMDIITVAAEAVVLVVMDRKQNKKVDLVDLE
jgi:hypothetical protein